SGSVIRLTANPSDEWVFRGWSGSVSSTTNPLEITVNQSKTITSTFVKRKYPLTINIQGEGTVTEEIISSGKTTTEYNSGSVIRLTANPSDGWEFSGWNGSVSSTENPIELSVNESKSIEVSFTRVVFYFVNRSPNYPSVNNNIGNIKKNYYHPGRILTPDIIINSISINENCDCFGCGCDESFTVLNDTSIYFDYNNDGRIDFFGFLENNSRGYRVGFGKYVLVDDVFNNPVSTYYDSNVWCGGRMELNDFNGDGIDDVLVYHENDHGDANGGHYSTRIPLEILYFNFDGSFTVSKIGPNTGTHDLVSFDIDNDGDIDIVNNEWWYDDPEGIPQLPLFYINDGMGNFSTTNTKFEQSSFYQNLGLDFNFTGVDAFDLDNDGFVDLLIGGTSEQETQYCVYDNPYDEFEQNCYTTDYQEDIRVFWGSSSFTYSEENSTRVTLPFYENGNSKLSYGFGFIDINNDGEYEIVNVGTNIPRNGVSGPNSGGYLEIFLNNGDRTFTSVSRDKMDVYEWDYANNNSFDTGDIPLFYFISVVDVDNDGDYDLLPHNINTGFISLKETSNGQDQYDYMSNIGENFHWRNDGGFFTLIDDRISYQN
ncbi:hypothetical protein OAC16_03550, partial [Flavobacteriaceae bacterium]|nr:hypothetical protein [Flavobacteriaceae bacterium]